MTGILSGIKVIEVASMAAAPNATVILADLGAEVIKVEPPSGDPWRYGHLTPGLPPSKIPWTTYIQNRTKKSVAPSAEVHPVAAARLDPATVRVEVARPVLPERQVERRTMHVVAELQVDDPGNRVGAVLRCGSVA